MSKTFSIKGTCQGGYSPCACIPLYVRLAGLYFISIRGGRGLCPTTFSFSGRVVTEHRALI